MNAQELLYAEHKQFLHQQIKRYEFLIRATYTVGLALSGVALCALHSIRYFL